MQRQKRQRIAAKELCWRKIVSGFDRGRTTVRQWCKDHGVSEPSFYAWRRELERRDRESAQRMSPRFVPLAVAPPNAVQAVDSAVGIKLPSGLRLRVPVERLAAVLDVLESRSC